MRAVIQRVTRASVAVNGGEPRPIGPGLVILLGVRDTDDIAIVPKLADLAVPCYEKFLDEMSHQGLKDVQHGEFGADMKIDLVNDGPVTIVIDTDEWKK